MYFNNLEDLIDKMFDDFYQTLVKDKKFQKILTETNFVKNQKEINDIFTIYSKTINLDSYANFQIRNMILEIIKKYITIYLFLYIGFFYSKPESSYINNIVEITKNQSQYEFKILNFFNSESTSLIVESYQAISHINIYINSTPAKKDILSKSKSYESTIKFIESFNEEFIKTTFLLKDLNVSAHNIIKTFILVNIYLNKEKQSLIKNLELLESSEGEFIFIDIVMPKREQIDFRSIESLFTRKQIIDGVAYTFWDYITEYEKSLTYIPESNDEKILKLINTGLFIPITDDILLFHQSAEKYDKLNDQTKSKEDTKIRYIIDKIDSAIEPLNKKFYLPLISRKAILINNFEDIKIINKFINQTSISQENRSYLKELESYTLYPYISCKENDNGIHILLSKTIDAIRSVSFETKGEFVQKPANFVQMRTGSADNYILMKGFMIRPATKSLYCIKNRSLQNILSYNNTSTTNNSFELFIDYLINEFLENDSNDKPLYWFFNTKNDFVKNILYEQQNKFSNQDTIKHMLGIFYDKLIENIFLYIIELCKKENKSKSDITLQKVDYFIRKIKKNKINLSMTKDFREKIIDNVCANIITPIEVTYDEEDDKIYGLTGDIIRLKDYNKIKQIKRNIIRINTIDLSEDNNTSIKETLQEIKGSCQHYITLNRIYELTKSNPKLFTEELYLFLQRYVTKNIEGNYICKSCGFHLNISSYVQDGHYDDAAQKFVGYTMQLNSALEDIPEYEKYKGSIRSIDKYIDKIGLITNILYFVGSSTTIRSRRKLIIKDCIDILLINNVLLKKNYKERKTTSIKDYSVNNSELFAFDLDNQIFIFSSRDKDYLKPIKQNNVIAYIIFLMILELSPTQISYITGDLKGYCNFQVFSKISSTLFENLKFRKNNEGDTVKVKDYQIFCYVLYIMSCFISKYNMWNFESKDALTKETQTKAYRQKILPIIQKKIIHTVIDIINNILENSSNNKLQIYEIISSKFYAKLNTIFSNDDLYKRFQDNNKSSNIEGKNVISTKQDTFKLTGKFIEPSYDAPHFWRKCTPHRLLISTKFVNRPVTLTLTNLTNCESGEFHKWINDKNLIKCSVCSTLTNDLTIDSTSSEKIIMAYNEESLRIISNKYCYTDGEVHLFRIDEKTGINTCIKCLKPESYTFSKSELEKLEKNIALNKKNKSKENDEKEQQKKNAENNNLEYLSKLSEKIKAKYNETKLYTFIDTLIDLIETSLSSEQIMIPLKNNLYIIKHDHLGNLLDKPIKISEKDNKINLKENHPVLKTNVLYYTSYSNGKVEVFYDALTLILIAYKEENKNMVILNDSSIKITLIYSLKNKIQTLGYPSNNISLINEKKSYLKEYIHDTGYDIDDNLRQILLIKILRNHHQTLVNHIYRFQRIIYRIINGYGIKKKNYANIEKYANKYPNLKINPNQTSSFEEPNYFTSQLDTIIEKYYKKLSSMSISNEKDQHQIFKHWKGIDEITKIKDSTIINIDSKSNIITNDNLNMNNPNGMLLLFYICTEITNLILFNSDKTIRQNICLMIIDFIDMLFNLYNEEKYIHNIEYKKFYYFIHSATYIDNVKDIMGETEGIYSELVEELTEEEKKARADAKEDADEEGDALDMEDDEVNYEGDLDREVNRTSDIDMDLLHDYSFQDFIESTKEYKF
jgi:hypothetical protein